VANLRSQASEELSSILVELVGGYVSWAGVKIFCSFQRPHWRFIQR